MRGWKRRSFCSRAEDSNERGSGRSKPGGKFVRKPRVGVGARVRAKAGGWALVLALALVRIRARVESGAGVRVRG